MNNDTGKIIIGIGAIVILIGIIIYFFSDKLHFIGNLPGDIRVKKENFRFYFPITSIVLFSVVLNILIRVVRYFFP